MNTGSRIFVALSGLCGCAGVALAAASAHLGGPNLATAAYFLLFHAPALLGVALASETAALPRRPVLLAGALLAAGVAAFSGALALGALAEWRPIPMAAPTGGVLLMAGWLALAATALLPRRR